MVQTLLLTVGSMLTIIATIAIAYSLTPLPIPVLLLLPAINCIAGFFMFTVAHEGIHKKQIKTNALTMQFLCRFYRLCASTPMSLNFVIFVTTFIAASKNKTPIPL